MAPSVLEYESFKRPGSGELDQRFDRRKYGYGFGAIGAGKFPSRLQTSMESVGGSGLRLATGLGCNGHGSTAFVDKDSAFMERAAASAPVLFPDRNVNVASPSVSGFSGSGVFNQGWKCVSDAKVYSGGYDLSSSHRSLNRGCRGPHATLATLSSSFGESEVCSGVGEEVEIRKPPVDAVHEGEMKKSSLITLDEDVARKPDLVTLSLLPDTPSHEEASPEVNRSASSLLPFVPLTMRMDVGSWEGEASPDDTEELHKLTLFSKGSGSAGSTALNDNLDRGSSLERQSSWGRIIVCEKQAQPRSSPGRPVAAGENSDRGRESVGVTTIFNAEDKHDVIRSKVIDSAYMEQVYSTSCDPVMLTDEDSTILWSNPAFERASSERFSGKAHELGPYIDPLGIPTQLSCFTYQPTNGPRMKAVLWGFLKKFMMLDSSTGNLLLEGRGNEIGTTAFERKFFVSSKDEKPEDSKNNVIVPQPIRPVGSTLYVERVTRVKEYASPITDSFETVKEQLELATLPTVITDQRNRVRWVNMAYKQMVGQPECRWLASTVGRKLARGTPQQSRLTGEVVLVCNEQLPQLSAVFSCLVHVQWSNHVGENSVIVPADVTRIDGDRAGNMYVWKLDVQTNSMKPQSGVMWQGSCLK